MGTVPGELQLPLSDLAHLFNAPPVAPLSHSPAEGLGISGVDHLLAQLYLDRNRQCAEKLVILLPPGKVQPELADETMQALRRQLQWRTEQRELELQNTYRIGWKATIFSLLVLAICLGLSSLFSTPVTMGMNPLVRATFASGFEIIGWVILWHPVDILVFSPLEIRARLGALRALAAMKVEIRAQEPPK